MTPEQFCYWLQGYAEISGAAPDQVQWDQIKEHLQLVFRKVTSTPQPLNPLAPALPSKKQIMPSIFDQTQWQPSVIC